MAKNKNVVTIGGGTGSFMLLSGLKKYPLNLSAIVSMADDGGSTGVLRDELGVLPPGDVRQCLVALSDSSEMLRRLMSYRFENGRFKGHSFGNLFLSALEKINGSFSRGVEEASKILNVKGEVIPVSDENIRLHIRLKDGGILVGEKQLDRNEDVRSVGISEVFLKPGSKAQAKALQKIEESDFIIIGPGDLYGSILPNLLVRGISEAIRKSRAKVIFNCNLTNKKGQTDGFDLERYVAEIEKHIGKGRVGFAVFNSKKLKKNFVSRYEKREGAGTLVRIGNGGSKRSFKVVRADIIRPSRQYIRHDSDKLAGVLMGIIGK